MNFLPALFRQRKLEQELDKELRFHFEQHVRDNLAAGMSPEEARRQAALEFGGFEQIKESCRDERRGKWADSLGQDLRYAGRQLRKSPIFTLTIVLTLALGIGANTALFSIVRNLVLQPLPRATGQGLVDIIHGPTEWVERWKPDNRRRRSVAPADFFDWKAQSRSFEDMTWLDNYADTKNSILRIDGNREPVATTRVWANFFPLLRVTPILGRAFRPEDDALTAGPVAVLSYGLWQRQFGGDRSVIGRTVGILKFGSTAETLCTIVGVLPRDMPMFDKVELWLSQPMKNRDATQRPYGQQSLVIARLRPGVTVPQAQHEMDFITQRIYRAHPGLYKGERGWSVTVTPVLEIITEKPQRHLLIICAIAGCVLLIACANVANLLLVRAAQRGRELAVRAVLGADRWRLARQLFAESLLLALLGGAAGIILAVGDLALFNAFAPENLYGTTYRAELPLESVALDGTALGFTLALALGTGILFGVIPALRGSRADLNGALNDGGPRAGAGPRGQRLTNALVVVQVMLALVLVSSAALLGNSFVRLENEPLGYEPARLLRFTVGLSPRDRFVQDTNRKEMRNVVGILKPKPQRDIFVHTFVERLKAIPGVQDVGIMDEEFYSTPIFIDQGAAPPPIGPEWKVVWWRRLSPDACRAAGIRLVRGRTFTEQDTGDETPVAIVNEAFVRQYQPDRDALGSHFVDTFGLRREIVGVVADNLFASGTVSLGSTPGTRQPLMYLPLLQPPLLQGEGLRLRFYVRTGAAAQAMLPAFREALRAVDREQTISDFERVETDNRRAHGMSRFYLFVFGSFAGLGLLISAVGIYGLTAYAVARRTHEIGVRMALGAQRSNVLALVLRQGMALAVLGVVLGIAGALVSTRALSGILYGVKPHDPATFGVVTLLLIAVALLACYLPARRATKVDPIVALRCD